MTRYTPLYGLPALEPSSRARDIADVDWANALQIEQILANQGQPPLDSDLQSLITRLNALEKPRQLLAQPAQALQTWSRAAGGQSVIASIGLNTATPLDVELAYYVIIDSGGNPLGGNLSVALNGTQVGVAEPISTPGATKGSWLHTMRKPMRTVAGQNTIEVRVTAESASSTIYGNRPTYEVWGRA